jgi:DNA-binding MarR family transcriptional regulator
MSIEHEIKQQRPFPSHRQSAVVGLLRTADVVGRFVDSVIERHGITGQQYNVLRILRGAGERGLPTLEIAERMIQATPGITRLIDRLEAKELVTRERCTTDRRQVFCCITRAGLDLLKQLDAPVDAAGEAALDALSHADIKQLTQLLDRARDRVHQHIEKQRKGVPS